MVRKTEALLKAQRNALMQQLRLLTLLAGHQERTPVLDQFDFVRGKASDGHGDPVLVFALLLDVVRRPVGANALIEQVEEAVEADRRAIVGGKVKSSHSHILREATWI